MEVKKNEIYDLKYHIADYIVPRLTAYIDKFKKGESPSSAIFKDEEKKVGRKLTFEENDKMWISILEDIIFPFDLLHDPNKYEKLDSEEILIRKKRGLELFSKYFEDLWI